MILKNIKAEGRREIFIDISAMKHAGCKLRFRRIVRDGYKIYAPGYKVHFGTAFHRFLEGYYKQEDYRPEASLFYAEQMMLCEAEEEKINTTYLPSVFEQTMDDYENYYPLVHGTDVDGLSIYKNAEGYGVTEGRFAFPIFETTKVVVYFCGTIDLIGRYRDEICVCDHKTSGNPKDEVFLQAARLSHQLIGYCVALRNLGDFYGKPEFHSVGALINGIFLSKTKPFFKRSPLMHYSEDLYQTFELEILALANFVASESSDYRDGVAHGECYGWYASCPFFESCCFESEAKRQEVLDLSFKREAYSPLTRESPWKK